jgi:hypothetical protein
MSKGDKKAIFQKFNLKNIKKEIATRQAVKRAKKFSKDMLESKKQAREDFMEKLLENAKLFNEAHDDFVKEDEEVFFDEDGKPLKEEESNG